MKALIVTVILTLSVSACRQKPSGPNAENLQTGKAKIEFASEEHDFGIITEGEKVGWYFKFINTGQSELVIHNASASCGCTVPEYSKEPIPPGGEGTIRVVFDSSGRSGSQIKQLTIESNGEPNYIVLTLKAEIKDRMSN